MSSPQNCLNGLRDWVIILCKDLHEQIYLPSQLQILRVLQEAETSHLMICFYRFLPLAHLWRFSWAGMLLAIDTTELFRCVLEVLNNETSKVNKTKRIMMTSNFLFTWYYRLNEGLVTVRKVSLIHGFVY